MFSQSGGSEGQRSSRRHKWPGRCGDGFTSRRAVVLTWRLRGAAVVQAGVSGCIARTCRAVPGRLFGQGRRATRPWAGRREVAESRKRADRRNTMRASPAPRRAARSAATTPAGPAPMTTTSSSSGGDEAITRSSGSAATAVITQAGEADATSRVRDDDVRDDGCAGSSRAGHGSGQLAIAGSACRVSGIRQLTLLAATGS